MHIQVLGCSGAIAKDCRTTSFLLDDHALAPTLAAVHAVPAVGFAAASIPVNKKVPIYWVFSGDTERNPEFWARIHQLQVGML